MDIYMYVYMSIYIYECVYIQISLEHVYIYIYANIYIHTHTKYIQVKVNAFSYFPNQANSFPERLAPQGLRLRADAGGAEHGLVDGQLLAARRQAEFGPEPRRGVAGQAVEMM